MTADEERRELYERLAASSRAYRKAVDERLEWEREATKRDDAGRLEHDAAMRRIYAGQSVVIAVSEIVIVACSIAKVWPILRGARM